MSQDNVPSIVEALQECFETGEYADMTITCEDKIWRVHKVVVCSQVPFFAKAVTGRFKEAVDSCIDLVDDDPSAVEVMLRWLYYGTFQVEKSKPPSMSTILFLARSYTIADKYLLADLRTTVGQKLRAALMHRDWDVEDLLALIEESFAGADEFSSVAPELLRTWVISAAHANYTFCFHSSPSHMRFREVTSSRPDFLSGVRDLVEAERSRNNRKKQFLYAGAFGNGSGLAAHVPSRPGDISDPFSNLPGHPPKHRSGPFWQY
ncbi:hypothetical protein D0862_06679 [Hortaea werneckii]|uniref:BTB domain-containing protein n=1 Tax=Hortaea werneckii TaxID=91943 RepID=A0A3M7GIP0_HORWE|nr:hypothetical protein D0862_06679 [Hortaea werneckii]